MEEGVEIVVVEVGEWTVESRERGARWGAEVFMGVR